MINISVIELSNGYNSIHDIPCIDNLYKTEDADVERQIFREIGAKENVAIAK